MDKETLVKKIEKYKNKYRNHTSMCFVYYVGIIAIVYLKLIHFSFPILIFFMNQIAAMVLHCSEIRERVAQTVTILEDASAPGYYSCEIQETEKWIKKLYFLKWLLFYFSWFWLGLDILYIFKILN